MNNIKMSREVKVGEGRELAKNESLETLMKAVLCVVGKMKISRLSSK